MIGYRNDIDGLRAIAVSLVILHHLGLSFFSGGFVGVDVFFVISGFVIFRGVINKTGISNFSTKDFYKRRIRRIFPSLLVTIIFSYLVGLILLTPNEMQGLLESGIAAAFSLSNFYFHDNAENYFSPAAATLPLLHTWSLGVEEQFYIFVPLLFILLKKLGLSLNSIILNLTFIIAISFILNVFAVHSLGKFSDAFYLPVTRFWEIAIGGLVATIEARSKSISINIRRLLVFLGYSGLLSSVLIFDESTSFPGIPVLMPVISTALIIWAYSDDLVATRKIIQAKWMIFTGKVSYSLYLFHWPVIVYISIFHGRSLTLFDMLIAVSLTIVLAVLTTKYIEEPLRNISIADVWGGLKWGILAGVAIILATSAIGFGTSGFLFRLNDDAYQAFISHQISVNHKNNSCVELNTDQTFHKATICSSIDAEYPYDYGLWGDSHAAMYRERLFEHLKNHNASAIYYGMADCQPLIGVITNKQKNREECRKLSREILERTQAGSIRNIILAARWANLSSPIPSPGDGELSKFLYNDNEVNVPISFEEALLGTVKALSVNGANIIVLGPVPEIDYSVPEMLVRSFQLDKSLPDVKLSEFLLRQSHVMNALSKIESMKNVTVIYPHKQLCDESTCKTVLNSNPIYDDDDHLSDYGVKYLMPFLSDKIKLRIE